MKQFPKPPGIKRGETAMNKTDLSNALTEVELSHKRGSAVFEEITRNLFEDTTPNSEYSCQYEHYVALADTVNKCLHQTGELISKLREDIRHE